MYFIIAIKWTCCFCYCCLFVSILLFVNPANIYVSVLVFVPLCSLRLLFPPTLMMPSTRLLFSFLKYIVSRCVSDEDPLIVLPCHNYVTRIIIRDERGGEVTLSAILRRLGQRLIISSYSTNHRLDVGDGKKTFTSTAPSLTLSIKW